MTLRRRGENGYLTILRMQIPPDKYSADLRIKHMSPRFDQKRRACLAYFGLFMRIASVDWSKTLTDKPDE
jgi:hypothetical protein